MYESLCYIDSILIAFILGNIMGIKKKDEEEDQAHDKDSDTTDYKAGQKFAEHMSKADSGSSDFARKKTITEQRRYLPVFAVRQELLNVIRENSVVIIVGKHIQNMPFKVWVLLCILI